MASLPNPFIVLLDSVASRLPYDSSKSKFAMKMLGPVVRHGELSNGEEAEI